MNTTTPILADRDIRQREIIPPRKLATCHAVVVGVGAIGRQVAVQLAAIGMSRMTLIDHDTVGVENLAPQAYWPGDIGKLKVEATVDLCRTIHPLCDIDTIPKRFGRSMIKMFDAQCQPAISRLQPIIFACVDCMQSRALIWEVVRHWAAFFVDGRMSAEVMRVLAVANPDTDNYYSTTLFSPEQAFVGSCTAKSTVYTASIAAGLMLSQFTKWLRAQGVERDSMLNLLAGELILQ